MLTVTADELAGRLRDLLGRVAAGEEIEILDHGRAVARLVGDRVRLRERLAPAVAVGAMELGADLPLPAPNPARVGGNPASALVQDYRRSRDDRIAGSGR
mgnify:CR=1 FL=1